MTDILFLPIDINLTGFDFTQFDNSIQLTAFNPYWNSSVITDDTVIKNKFNLILEQLPFTKITVLTYKEQKSIVKEHVDVHPEMKLYENELSHIRLNEPSGYRFVISGATDAIEVFNGYEWVTARAPQIPCCYVLNATGTKHRIKEDLGRRTIYVRGFLDEEKHLKLLSNSYDMYKEYAIKNLVDVYQTK
jgi:hypothetical protein